MLSAAGVAAEEGHRSAVAGARGGGRTALDAALAAWAAPLSISPGDGVVLRELLAKPRGLADVSAALEDAGFAAAEIRATMGRLVAAGLVELVPLASQVEKAAATPEPLPPRTRWGY